jgi:hypothetical protein
MSSAFCVVAGWGMPWHAFEERTTLDCEAHRTSDALHEAFASAEVSRFQIGSREADQGAFSTSNILIDNIRQREEDVFTHGAPESLYTVVTEGEENAHVVFFPDCYHAKCWSRRDDDLDIAFLCRWKDGNDRMTVSDNAPFVRYLPYGHGHWANSLMLADGSSVPWQSFVELRKRPDILPAVPPEIRLYLDRLAILDRDGANTLRPLIAHWVEY